MTRAEWDQWQFEQQLVESLLGPIEADTTNTFTRALIGQLRRALTRTATNPRTAARLALLVGLRTGDRVRKTLVRELRTVKARKANAGKVSDADARARRYLATIARRRKGVTKNAAMLALAHDEGTTLEAIEGRIDRFRRRHAKKPGCAPSVRR